MSLYLSEHLRLPRLYSIVITNTNIKKGALFFCIGQFKRIYPV